MQPNQENNQQKNKRVVNSFCLSPKNYEKQSSKWRKSCENLWNGEVMLILPRFHIMHLECLHKFVSALTELMARRDLHQKF